MVALAIIALVCSPTLGSSISLKLVHHAQPCIPSRYCPGGCLGPVPSLGSMYVNRMIFSDLQEISSPPRTFR